MSEIIININEANKAQKYQNKNELFQIEAFEKVSKILQEHTIDDDKTKDITDCRFHDTIFIDGDRGVGKTAFMINIQHYYDVIDCNNNNNCMYSKDYKKRPKYIFLKPVDPTLLEHTEKFLSVILARIVEYVNDNKQDVEKGFEEKYYKSLENLSKSLEAIKTLDKDVGIEEIASNKSSLKLEQHAHEFFYTVSKMFAKDAIVMLIDDVDMAFDKGFDVLEVVRKYLASPYLIPIVAGDMKLYREIVETKFMEKIDFYKDVSAYNQMKSIFEKGCSDDRQVTKSWDISKFGCDHELLIQNRQELKDKKHLLNHLVEQYLRKVFPNEYHIKLKNIFTILKENKVQVKLKDDLEVPYTEIKDFEIRHINLGINQVEFTYQIFSNNTRDLVQYLFAKKDIYIEFFTKIKDKYPKEAIHKKYIPQNVIDKYDNDIFQYLFKDTTLYKKSLEITSNIYEYGQDKQKELSKLAENDVKAFDGKTYNIYKAFTGHVFENSKLDTEKSKDSFVIYYKSYDKAKKFEDMDKFIVDLFVHANYYTQKNETKRYIFAGKFIELMFFSLQLKIDLNINNINKEKYPEFFIVPEEPDDKKYDWIIATFFDTNKEMGSFEKNTESINKLIDYFNLKTINLRENDENILDKISYSIPFNSIFKKNKNYEALTDNSIQNEGNDTLSYISHDKDFLLKLTKEIAIWRSVCIDDVKINSISMYEIIHKFFNNLNLLKEQRLVEETPISFLRRIVFIFINAVAFFENNNTRTAQTNIAMAKKFDIDILLNKTNAYNQNIKPLLNEKSLTKSLFFHPIISYLLNDTKLQFDDFRLSDVIFEGDEILVQKYGFKSGIGQQTRIDIMKKLYQDFESKTFNEDEISKLKASSNFKNLLGKSYKDSTYQELKKNIEEFQVNNAKK